MGQLQKAALDIGSSLLASVTERSVNFSKYGLQPCNQIRAIRQEFESLVRQGISIPVLCRALREVGVKCSDSTVRRYIQREHPEVYADLYGRNGRKTDQEVGRKKTGSNEDEENLERASKEPPKSAATQSAEKSGSIYDESNRVRANPDSFLGEGMSDTFEFLRPKKRDGK